MKIHYIFYLLTISLLLNSCGTKGELYIPEERYPQAMIYDYIFPVQKSEIA